jgi:hypothetical protein
VDLGAIFRLAPGLLGRPTATGTAEFVVDEPDRQSAYTFTLAEDGVTVEERSADGADARVAGTVEDWVKAFSPERDRSGLHVTGDQPLAEALLEGLTSAGRRGSARAQQAA